MKFTLQEASSNFKKKKCCFLFRIPIFQTLQQLSIKFLYIEITKKKNKEKRKEKPTKCLLKQ